MHDEAAAAQYLGLVRWKAVACAAVLAGCQQLQPTAHPTMLPGPFPEGEPKAAVTIGGDFWDVCSARQRKQYPPVLDEPAPTYYAGPWCRAADGGTQFLWVYAEPLFPGEQPEQIRRDVNADAGLLVRNLRTTGYAMVSSAGKDEDVRYEARRPTSPNVVTVGVEGQNPPPQGQAYSGTDPLRLIVAVRKAGPADTPAPTP